MFAVSEEGEKRQERGGIVVVKDEGRNRLIKRSQQFFPSTWLVRFSPRPVDFPTTLNHALVFIRLSFTPIGQVPSSPLEQFLEQIMCHINAVV
jgi:hypothetical protein